MALEDEVSSALESGVSSVHGEEDKTCGQTELPAKGTCGEQKGFETHQQCPIAAWCAVNNIPVKFAEACTLEDMESPDDLEGLNSDDIDQLATASGLSMGQKSRVKRLISAMCAQAPNAVQPQPQQSQRPAAPEKRPRSRSPRRADIPGVDAVHGASPLGQVVDEDGLPDAIEMTSELQRVLNKYTHIETERLAESDIAHLCTCVRVLGIVDKPVSIATARGAM